MWLLTDITSTLILFISCLLVLLCVPTSANDFESTLGHLKSSASWDVQENAVRDLIQRLTPARADSFIVSVNPGIGPIGRDTFQVTAGSDSDDRVSIVGTSGVAAAWGYHHYLKHSCQCHVSWDSDQLSLPARLPSVNITVTSPDRFRYYQNVCTTSYSFVWWDWPRWEREIDWMALNGYNLVLAFNGQEAIWRRVYHQLNLTDADVDDHFSGPAFLSWNRMGNMRGWGGSLSGAWHNASLALQHNILRRMRQLGIVPVLPAFAGHVPRAFKRLFPANNMTLMGKWNSFEDKYCCPYLLEPTDKLFRTVGNLFTSELIAEFGTDHAYNCDTFNEMTPRTGDPTYLAHVGQAVFRAMTDVDPKAIWVLQAWLFINDATFWQENQARAFLTSVPTGRMIVLDLQSELLPQFVRFHSYFGQPFIWCMLHNFGGTLGLYGSVDNVNKGVPAGRSLENGTMIGTGLTPEGIHQNYVVYELMNEMAYRTSPADLTEWFSAYARRRYGNADEDADRAWQLLKSSVYNFTGSQRVRGKYIICRRPSLKLRPLLWYDPLDVAKSWDHLLLASPSLHTSANYQHDLVDVTRQSLQLVAAGYYTIFVAAFKKGDVIKFQKYADLFLHLVSDLDRLLGSNKDFLLGSWLSAAKARASSSEESKLFEFNARNQITLWGPKGEILDYANKQWAGVVSHYFLPRWTLFSSALNDSLVNHTTFNEQETSRKIFLEVEEPFTLATNVFPDKPQGDSVAIATELHGRWRNQTRALNALKRFRLQPAPNRVRISGHQKRSTPFARLDSRPEVFLV